MSCFLYPVLLSQCWRESLTKITIMLEDLLIWASLCCRCKFKYFWFLLHEWIDLGATCSSSFCLVLLLRLQLLSIGPFAGLSLAPPGTTLGGPPVSGVSFKMVLWLQLIGEPLRRRIQYPTEALGSQEEQPLP